MVMEPGGSPTSSVPSMSKLMSFANVESPQLGCLPNIIQPPLGGVVNAASAVSARTVT